METKQCLPGMMVLCAIMLNLSACSQDGTKKEPVPKDTEAVIDTPKVDIQVNKRYDEAGNLIAFDSTYTSIYRGRTGDQAFLDSVFRDFKPMFRSRYPFLEDPGFNDLFFQDSLMHHDFFHDDFFRRRMQLNEEYLQRMMEEMDAMKNDYLDQQMQRHERSY
ncbi:MAG: hypothetical protein R2818_12660 [Flavobacteriales bacterium]